MLITQLFVTAKLGLILAMLILVVFSDMMVFSFGSVESEINPDGEQSGSGCVGDQSS